MAAGDVIVRLLLNATGFGQQLGKSKKDVSEWEQAITSMGSKAGAAFKGIAGAVGVAFGAVETFNRIVTANEANNDKWENTIRTATNSVNEFFSAITSGDFSLMGQGLDTIAKKAELTAEALRQIDDATMAYGYFSSKYQAEFTDKLNILRDKSASEEDKAAAKARAQELADEQKALSESLYEKAKNAAFSTLTQRSILSNEGFDLEDLEKVLVANTRKGYDDELKLWEEQKKEYDSLLNELNMQFTTSTTMRSSVGVYNVDTLHKEDPEYQSRLAELNSRYRLALLNDAVYNKTNGDDLRAALGFLQQGNQAQRNAASMETRLIRYGGSGTASGGKEDVYEEGSIGYLENRLKEAQEAVTAATTDTARIAAMETVAEIQKQLDALDLKTRTLVAAKTGDFIGSGILDDDIEVSDVKLPELPAIDLGDRLKEVEPLGLPDSGSIDDTASSIVTLTDAVGSLTGALDEGSASWLQYGVNVIKSIAQAIPAIAGLTAAKETETAVNSKAAAVKAGESVAGIPFAGAAMAIAAIASVVAAIAAIPEFAEGGVVGGNSYYGDRILARLNSGELVLNKGQQASLVDRLDGNVRDIRITGELTAKGRDLSLVLDDYNIYRRQ